MFNKFKEKAASLGNSAIEQHFGTIQSMAQQQVGPKMNEIGNDEAKLKMAFKVLYIAMPTPVKLVLKEEVFVTFCMENRHRLLEQKAA